MNRFFLYQSVEAGPEDQNVFGRAPDVRFNYSDQKLTSELLLYFSPEKRFLGLCVKVPNAQNERTANRDEFLLAQNASEYALAILRIIYSPFVEFKRPLMVTIAGDTDLPPFDVLHIPQSVPPDSSFDLQIIQQFGQILGPIQKNVDDDLWLLANSYNRRLPTIYRYHALTKIYEKHHGGGKTFDKNRMAIYFQRYQKEFEELKKELQLTFPDAVSYALHLRGKVSHRVYGGKDCLPSSIKGHFSYEVEQFIDRIAQRVGIDVLNDAFTVLPDPHPILIWKHPPGFNSKS